MIEIPFSDNSFAPPLALGLISEFAITTRSNISLLIKSVQAPVFPLWVQGSNVTKRVQFLYFLLRFFIATTSA